MFTEMGRSVAEVPADIVDPALRGAAWTLLKDANLAARALTDADMLPLWEALFSAHFYSGASIEERDGVPLPGAPYSCGTDRAVRVTSGTGETWETRSRCVEGDAAIAALADAIARAATRGQPSR